MNLLRKCLKAKKNILKTLESESIPTGICNVVGPRAQEADILRNIFKLWPRFSGHELYPINLTKMSPAEEYNELNKWVGPQKEMRLELLDFTIAYLKGLSWFDRNFKINYSNVPLLKTSPGFDVLTMLIELDQLKEKPIDKSITGWIFFKGGRPSHAIQCLEFLKTVFQKYYNGAVIDFIDDDHGRTIWKGDLGKTNHKILKEFIKNVRKELTK